MTTVTFYHQERVDGGVRTGLEVDGYTLLEEFRGGPGERDPALLWYVDVRCEGSVPPFQTADDVRQWLRGAAPGLRDALLLAATHLAAGVDVELAPWEWTAPNPVAGLPARVVVSAQRRVAALDMAARLRRLAGQDWEALAGHMAPRSAA